jgi:hypothetical protein
MPTVVRVFNMPTVVRYRRYVAFNMPTAVS